MNPVVTILLLLVAVVAAGLVARLARAPLPLVQIGLGVALALSAVPTVELRPEIFFLLFLPPLLFLDGWRIPKDTLFRDGAVVVELALGLVILTVVGLGWLIHLMIPAMPLPVAFALAAVVSPTDPTAVTAVTARTPMPARMAHILEGEALLNDASGLVCMRFAVAAAMTGAFSLGGAVLTFAWMALGGLAIGIVLTWGVTRATHLVSGRLGDDTSAQIVVSLLIPFGAYMLAEHFHCSGILAAVAAGVTMSLSERGWRTSAATRIRRSAVWDAVQFAANGVVFVLLGEQLPGILAAAPATAAGIGHASPWWLAAYVAAIVAALAGLRLAWVWVSLQMTLRRARVRGEPGPDFGWRLVIAMSLAGVRGAITLAGVLTLPLTLMDGSPFPARDLAITLAAGVIVTTLLISSIALPKLLRGLVFPPETDHLEQVDRARAVAAQAAINAIEQAQHDLGRDRPDADLYVEAAARLMAIYRRRITDRTHPAATAALVARFETVERQLVVAGLRAEREALGALVRMKALAGEEAARLIEDVDLLELRFRVRPSVPSA